MDLAAVSETSASGREVDECEREEDDVCAAEDVHVNGRAPSQDMHEHGDDPDTHTPQGLLAILVVDAEAGGELQPDELLQRATVAAGGGRGPGYT